jgi:hypothetical protein
MAEATSGRERPVDAGVIGFDAGSELSTPNGIGCEAVVEK